MEHSKHYLIRALAVVMGIFMVGIAVGLFKLAEMGADPFTAMNTGISSVLNMQFGTLQLFVNAGILVLIFLFVRPYSSGSLSASEPSSTWSLWAIRRTL